MLIPTLSLAIVTKSYASGEVLKLVEYDGRQYGHLILSSLGSIIFGLTTILAL